MNTKEKLREKRILKDINKTSCSCSCWKYQELDSNPKYVIWMCIVFIASMLILIAGCFVAKPAHASEIPENKAIRTLIGEASNQGEKGMICVAEVLRRQGSLKGFYGYKAKHIDHEPPYVWAIARKAWLASANTNYTHGANHFENINTFGCPSWVKNCVETFRYKDHVFYKEA